MTSTSPSPSEAPSATAAPLLEARGATLRFGGLTAVNGFDLSLQEGQLIGLIGPNGAGKTTVFNLITGIYEPTEGALFFAGKPLAGLASHERAALGIARTFQNIRLFPGLSVFNNVRAACRLHLRTGPWQTLWRGRAFRTEEAAVEQRAMELLDLFHLRDLRDDPAKSLPYGAQRRLEIVRCLATQPRLLLLDEPAAGMNPSEKVELMHLIRRVHQEFRLTILLVEHSMRVVMGVCERIAVLDYGVKIAEGTPAHIQSHPKVIEAYLGEPTPDKELLA